MNFEEPGYEAACQEPRYEAILNLKCGEGIYFTSLYYMPQVQHKVDSIYSVLSQRTTGNHQWLLAHVLPIYRS